ncbi:MAG: penicillin acylase family protein [Bryobacteraceae bacterium]
MTIRPISALLFAGLAFGESIPVAGLKQPVEILVDKWGVPHIYARNAADAFFAQGFNVARERLFQIDLWRRRGLGRTAEVMGPKYVEQDRAARLFLYRAPIENEWNAYGPDARKITESFVAGINAYVDWLAANPEQTPVEFKVLGYGPSKWEASEVVRIRSHGLTRNATSEVARAKTICATDPVKGPGYDQARFGLQPAWETKLPDGLDPCLPADVLKVFTLATQATPFAKPNADSNDDGSNNWAIAPSKSATGRAILAGDPHRAYSTPSLRYIAHVSAPGLDIIGAGEPAVPGISMGHNGTIAFGLTIFPIDQEDLYVYELNPADPHQYRYKGGWEALRLIEEPVAVKGAAAVMAELAFTRHGPVIYTDAARRRAYAIRTCWMEPGMSPYFASIAYMRARNFAEFQRGRFRGGAPTLNYVYADTKGNIGWSPGGMTPIRPNWDGLLPVPGDGRFEWAGFLRPDQFPSAYNPSGGYISTSNEMNMPDGYPYKERKLGFEWTNDSRHRRIDEVLRKLPKVSLADSMKLQTDLTSVAARRAVALLAGLTTDDLKTRAALAMLRGWDAVERAESAQAALFEVWWRRHLGPAFLAAALPAKAAGAITTPDAAVMLDALEGKSARFKVDARALLLATLGPAYLEWERLGEPQWGKLHQSLPGHPLRDFVNAEWRAKLQPGPFPAPGGPYSPSQSMYTGSSFQLTNGPSFRMVLDVGSWDESRAVNYPGQSGRWDDPHYRDLTGHWLRGEYFPLLYTRAAVEKATERRIVLEPR